MAKKAIKITAIVLAAIIGAMALTAGGYVAYVALQYYRIEDGIALEIENAQTAEMRTGEIYEVTTYNLGFGAYSPEYSFFMDTGVMKDGTEVAGIYAKGMNKEDVRKNVDGQIALSKAENADFYLFQEVDERADRSYRIDMRAELTGALDGYCSTYAQNFHTAWLLYPFNDPMGTTNAGILTLSKFRAGSAVRRSFPLTDQFIDKLFDLDRCFSVHYFPIADSEKQFVLINLHMSAYDKGGTVRAQQLAMLNEVLQTEREKGNYVVAGGDFNHCLIADRFENDEAALSAFPSEQETPEWVKNSVLHNRELAAGFRLAADETEATCRGADIPYRKGVNYTTTIDGFILSKNVELVSVKTVPTEYAYSDHNPVTLRFCFR